MPDNNKLRQRLLAVFATGRDLANGGYTNIRDFARQLASSDAVRCANAAALEVALANKYALRRSGAMAGRALTESTIAQLGLAAALASEADFDDQLVATQIAGFLAGPPVPHIQLVGIDADIAIHAPVTIGEWDLTVANASELRAMLPVPALSDLQPQRPWDPDRWAGTALLRRSFDRKVATGIQLSFPRAFPEWDVWRPLTVLAIAQPDVVTMWSEHEVEYGRTVLTRLDEVYYQIHSWGPADDDEVELPHTHSIGVTPLNETAFREAITRIEPLLPPSEDRRPDKNAKRIKLAAQHLLAAGRYAAGDPTPWDPVHATDSLLHYVVALEALLGSDTVAGEITRRVAQRAAVVAGLNDDERVAIDREVREAYKLRSKVMHGSAEPERRSLDKIRIVVRRALLARMVHSQGTTGTISFESLCDQALLSHKAFSLLRDPLTEFGDLTLPPGYA